MSSRTRLTPEQRREQLLELGTRLLATRTLDELTIDLLAEEAGVSRGLLYHYFGGKQEFHVAIVSKVVADLYEITGPRDIEDPLEQLIASIGVYVDFVVENRSGYVSLVRAAGVNDEIRGIYLRARRALTDRIFEISGPERLLEMGVVDGPATRLLVDGWAAFAEEVVLGWTEDPRGMGRDELLQALGQTFAAVVTTVRPAG